MTSVYINAQGVVCALGVDLNAVRQQTFASESLALTVTEVYSPGKPLPLGCVRGPLAGLNSSGPIRLRSRNNQLVEAALAPLRVPVARAVARYGPERVAVVLGSSTAGVWEGEHAAIHHLQTTGWPAIYDYAQQEMSNPAEYVAHSVGSRGPVYSISTACSSGAKAIASAARLLRAGLVDAVVAGGADALCRLTVAGFGALESISARTCNPMSLHRNGINIGEGAALVLMSRDPGPVRVAGWGETSDAHHMSAPDPSGKGAVEAMRQALARAGVGPDVVNYINLHGTATHHNDAMESRAVQEVFGRDVPVSSTKPLTGHALAAAGAIESVIASLCLADNPNGKLPPHWWDGVTDPALPALHLVQPGETLGYQPNWVMSNSFAFGGSNAVLLFSRE
ncbi:beta-ketoacyl-ACP synthase [Rhodoferax sp.]|uniref:beta-ketoacyl-ACP synthase n=1 Tax=Rhodoferax sp. TaxID=50421 RepID=UPI0019F67E23|nr:beta-ketoacyl-ACP synthase [Rhodoferax sp.]MBE0474610.1 beta-ketoacyl-ACP synthase [Rhodoferax sp.]